MEEQFISEPLRLNTPAISSRGMMISGPAVPWEFFWRNRPFKVAQVRRMWKDAGPCDHRSGEKYVRKHWFEVLTTDGMVMKIYFLRDPGRGRRAGWVLYSMVQYPQEVIE